MHIANAFAPQYKVKDIAEADFGRLEIELAEAEMPGLMACRYAGKGQCSSSASIGRTAPSFPCRCWYANSCVCNTRVF